MSTRGKHGVSSVAPGDPTRAQKGEFPELLHPLLHAVEWYPGQKHLFSSSDIHQLD